MKRLRLTELRFVLGQARRTLNLVPVPYTDPVITAGLSQVKAVHVNDLRSGIE